jgi:hypothetical protein
VQKDPSGQSCFAEAFAYRINGVVQNHTFGVQFEQTELPLGIIAALAHSYAEVSDRSSAIPYIIQKLHSHFVYIYGVIDRFGQLALMRLSGIAQMSVIGIGVSDGNLHHSSGKRRTSEP